MLILFSQIRKKAKMTSRKGAEKARNSNGPGFAHDYSSREEQEKIKGRKGDDGRGEGGRKIKI